MRFLAAFLLLFSVFGGQAAALERGASKALAPSMTMADRFVYGIDDDGSYPALAIKLSGEAIAEVNAVKGPCKGGDDCQYLVPMAGMSSGTLTVEHGHQAVPDNRPHHIWKLLRPPIG